MKSLRCIVNLIAICLVIYLGSFAAHATPVTLGHDHGHTIGSHAGLADESNGVDQHQLSGSLVHCGSPLISAVVSVEHYRAANRIGFIRPPKTRSAAFGLPPDIRPPRA